MILQAIQLGAIVVFKDANSVKDVLSENHFYEHYRLTVYYRYVKYKPQF